MIFHQRSQKEIYFKNEVLVKNLKYSQYNHFKTFKYANENIYIIEKSFLAHQNSIIKGKTNKQKQRKQNKKSTAKGSNKIIIMSKIF